jgi:C_GCAxxG_C_C family probable redox protein
VDHREARRLAHRTFVTEDNIYGCAETSYMVLKHAFGLPCPDDSGPAMALNGGVAYAGSICGALSGAALAVGELASARIADHAMAKRMARGLVRSVMDDFRMRFGSIECRQLIGFDLRQPDEHERFIDSGIWRRVCADQVEHAVGRLAELGSKTTWGEAMAELESTGRWLGCQGEMANQGGHPSRQDGKDIHG